MWAVADSFRTVPLGIRTVAVAVRTVVEPE
jgi:hypothetical protein